MTFPKLLTPPAAWQRFGASVAASLRAFPVAAGLLGFFTLAVVWGFWKGDVAAGDTSSYYAMAARWARKGEFSSSLEMAFSPLYMVVYAWVQRGFPDAGAATALHRVLIVLGAGITTLAALRQLIPRSWAWLAAACWVLINWRVQYEVHIFGHLLLMAGAAAAGGTRSPWGRGVAIALLGTTAALVRNEHIITTGLFALCCLYALWRAPRQERWPHAVALVVPSLLALAAVVWLFSGDSSQLSLSRFRRVYESRQRMNLQQVYPFSYLQRHDDWAGDPWRGGASLMERDFGQAKPLMGEALRAAPAKFMEHCLWNLRLLPAGVQEGLFGGYTGSAPPDFAIERPPGVRDPLIPSILVVAVWIAGAWLLIRRRRESRPFLLHGSPHLWTWIFLFCCLPTTLVAIVTQRPRPSYIFPLTILLMAFTALALRLLLKEWQKRGGFPARRVRWVPVFAAVVLGLLLPPRFHGTGHAQPLLDDYHRISGLPEVPTWTGRTLCTNAAKIDDLVRYLHRGGAKRPWKLIRWTQVLEKIQGGKSLEQALEQLGATEFYFRHDGAPLQPAGAPRAFPSLSSPWRQLGRVEGDKGWTYWTNAMPASRGSEQRAPQTESPDE